MAGHRAMTMTEDEERAQERDIRNNGMDHREEEYDEEAAYEEE